MNDDEYWQHGKRHREGGPAVETFRLGSRYCEWWQNGRLGRENGPAVEWSFIEEWWRNGQRHRLDGPAIVQRRPSQVMPQPPVHCPPYPGYGQPAPGPVLLKQFQSHEILNVSRWLNDACYGRLGFFTSHGDFGAQVAVILDGFHPRIHASGNIRAQLEEKIIVKIVNYGRQDHLLDTYFPGPTADHPEPEVPEDTSPNLLDLLGQYSTTDYQITLFMPTIVACAQKLDARIQHRFGSPCAMTLFMMVLLHELGHAIHHFTLCFTQGQDLGITADAENHAQHFTMTCIESYGNRAKDVFDELEKHQPKIYRKWPNLGPCTWENCRSKFPNFEEKFKKFQNSKDLTTALDLTNI